MVENRRRSMLDCCEPKYQQYASVADSLRTSRYLTALPKLPVHCPEIDGDVTTLPVIFEDVYQDEMQVGRRHSLGELTKPNGEKSSSDEGDGQKLLSLNEVLSGEASSAKAKKPKKTDRNGKVGSGRKVPRPISLPHSNKQIDGVSFF